ncbi:MAG: hypothetical protein ACYSTY_10965 [Planctomycetota bacterium]|jgi:hypothetical protein
MSSEPTLWQRFRQLPRAIQWAAYAAAGTFLFIGVSDYVWAQAEDWNQEAHRIEMQFQSVREGQKIAGNLLSLRDPLVAHGAIRIPDQAGEGGPALDAAVTAVMNRHSIRHTYDRRRPVKLKGSLATIRGGRDEAQSISADLRFEASPEDAMAVIAQLESSPDIEAISNVRITRLTGARRLKVHLTLEAWVFSNKPTVSRRRGSA